MGQKALSAAFISALLITALAGALLIGYAKANFAPPTPPKSIPIYVQAPVDGVYNTTDVPLKFYVAVNEESKVLSVQYWLDGKLIGQYVGEDLPKNYSITLTVLPDGNHSVRVETYVHYSQYFSYAKETVSTYMSGYSDVVFFKVDVSPPSIHVLTSQKTYSTSNVPLNLIISEPVTWLGYSLDGAAPVTITGNTTLHGLPHGTHTIIVQAEDTAGNTGAAQPITFKVETQTATQQTKPQSEPEPFPTTLIAVAVAVIVAAVVSVGLLVYFKKRKHYS